MSKERSTRTGDMPEMVLQVYFEVQASREYEKISVNKILL